MNQLFKLSDETFKASHKMLTESIINSLDINENIKNISNKLCIRIK